VTTPAVLTPAARDRVFYDIAQVLESVVGAEARVTRVLEHLRALVSYGQSAVLEAQPGAEPRLFVVPGTPPDMRARLEATLVELLVRVTDEHWRAPASPSKQAGSQLAVPLVGFDRVIGLLMVQSDGVGYDESDLHALSVVAANLGAYLAMVRARAEEADRTRELDEARRAAEAANRTKDEFIALVSHELKTPLTSTLACVQILRSPGGVGDEARSRALEAIERNIHAQAALIDEILDLACIGTAELRLDLEAVEPASLIRKAVEGLRLRAQERSISLDCVLDGSVDEILVDPDRFDQVVSNLLANAIKFTPNRGRVEVRLERAGTHARIQIVDTGRGISAEFLPHVFECFRQEERVTTRKYGGLGAGLAISKMLVERQGGSIRAESRGHGRGATFTVELPLASDPSLSPLTPDSRGSALAGIRVLLVDDDDDIRFAFQTVLELHGAEVLAVASAGEALEKIQRSIPDVLLSDLAMPGESGYDLMRVVAAQWPSLPAAALSAHGSLEDRERALSMGFRIHIKKPITTDALVAAVAELAGRAIAKGAAA
jgi:signal transduction histidine kinase/ActR/RegA family two-component response regulator